MTSAEEILRACLKVVLAENFAIETEVSKKVEYHQPIYRAPRDLTVSSERDIGLLAKGYEINGLVDELFISSKQDSCLQYPCPNW